MPLAAEPAPHMAPTVSVAAVKNPQVAQERTVQVSSAEFNASNVLGYLDQAFFTSLRALGRQPICYFLWHYQHPLDEAAVNRFNQRLAQGLLGRLLQRSPLPWGRHRWVANPVPATVTWYQDPVPVESLPAWRNSLVQLPLDPEHGPGWRLAVQSLADGGAALALLICHTIADGKAAGRAIVDAVTGRPFEPSFPLPSERWSPVSLLRDSMESLRALPSVWCALKALMRQPKPDPRLAAPATDLQRLSRGSTEEPVQVLPLAQVIMNAQTCQDLAAKLGVKSNTLVAAVAVRLAFRLDRLGVGKIVDLVLPVSDRQQGDWRGNALRAVTVPADPDTCYLDPGSLLESIRAALQSPDRHLADPSLVLPLVPYVPRWLIRRFERKILPSRLPTTCSLLGELHPDMNRPCGEASLLQISMMEPLTVQTLERLRGGLLVVGYRLGGRLMITVMGHKPGYVTTCAELRPHVKAALSDLGLEGNVS